jgi:2-polyprenyl-3-methyl-5-hydroxy-6-metoxy-1,4-benzoquinol methylase
MTREGRKYREAMYTKYASIQATSWLKPDVLGQGRASGGILTRLRGWIPVDRNATLVDLGCGPGNLLVPLRDAGYNNLRGVDIGLEAIRIAKSQRLDVVQVDVIEFLRESEDTFDVIFALDLIEHLTKDEVLEFLKLAQRCLKPGGHLVLQTPNALSPWASHLRYGDLTHELIFTPQSIASTLRLTGFGNTEVRQIKPRARTMTGLARCLIWNGFWALCALWNLAETGSLLGGIYSRNMLVRAAKDVGLP